MSTTTVKAYGAKSSKAQLEELKIERRALNPKDVKVKIEYCGVCHSDIHTIRNDWGGSKYPCVPGHEIIGIVEEIGEKVHDFKVGQTVGVGCMVGSCRTCSSCQDDLEQYCEKGLVGTYNGKDDPNRFYYRSDHYNFAKFDIPVIFYFNGTHEDYHRPTDTPDKINYELLSERTKLIFFTAWEIANREERPYVDKPTKN
jgi:D-arabinose 1-dehydrogenase-like Zn-dependent alcohol dehydrogenase